VHRGPSVTKEHLELQEKDLTMCRAVKRLPVGSQIAKSSIDSDIRDFLAGKTDGEGLLHALYDHVLDEPVPERLHAVLRG
jgi:hypothetical protein